MKWFGRSYLLLGFWFLQRVPVLEQARSGVTPEQPRTERSIPASWRRADLSLSSQAERKPDRNNRGDKHDVEGQHILPGCVEDRRADVGADTAEDLMHQRDHATDGAEVARAERIAHEQDGHWR